MIPALLLGKEPPIPLGYRYVDKDYEAIVIGSLTIAELLYYRQEQVLDALGEGTTVVLYTPGLPQVPKNRGLAATLAAARRQLKTWGVVFTDGAQRRLITAQEARNLRAAGKCPEPGAVLTPLAKEIMEGLQ